MSLLSAAGAKGGQNPLPFGKRMILRPIIHHQQTAPDLIRGLPESQQEALQRNGKFHSLGRILVGHVKGPLAGGLSAGL